MKVINLRHPVGKEFELEDSVAKAMIEKGFVKAKEVKKKSSKKEK